MSTPRIIKLDREQYLNLGYSRVVVGEPDEKTDGQHGTMIRIADRWYSVHLAWHPRMLQWSKPYMSTALGVDPTIKLWGVRS
jgi:hypothetical protein